MVFCATGESLIHRTSSLLRSSTDGLNTKTWNRGYPIEQLAEQSTFLETAYLLIYGSLPTKKQYEVFEGEVMHHSIAHSDAEGLFRAFRYDAHPMSILTSAIASLGSMYSEVSLSFPSCQCLKWRC